MSDHNAVYLEFEFKAALKGKGIWKMIDSLLQDYVNQNFFISLSNDFEEKIIRKKENISVSWDIFKQKIGQVN